MTTMRAAILAGALASSSFYAVAACAQSQAGTPQEAASETGTQTGKDGEIIVNGGYRGSLNKARQLKKDANIIKDVIVAEDMAKFPELNLAESLQRLPGVAINREAGEGRRITLRGLGPDFTRVQLNGMEVLGNVDSAMDSRGQRSRDRAFDFSIFASDLFSRVEVEKSYSAAQSEGGMAGTVGLFTGKPFDYKSGWKGALSAQLGSNSYTKDAQPRFAGMLSYNADDTFGILISAAYSKRKTEEQGYDTYSPTQFSASDIQDMLNRGLNISKLSAVDQAKFKSGDLTFASGNRLSVWDADQKRLGLTLAAQLRPAENLLFTLDALHGEFETHRDEYHLATRPDHGSVIFNGAFTKYGKPFAASTINALTYDSTGFVNSADVDNVTYASEHRREVNKNKFNQIALTGEWEATSKLKFDGHIGYEKSKYDTPIDDKLYLEAQGGMVTQYAADGNSATNAYKWDTTNPNNYTIRQLYFRESSQETQMREGVANAHYTINDGLTLRTGFSYRKYESSGTEIYNDGLYGNLFKSMPGYDAVAPFADVFTGQKSHSWIVGDWAKMLAFYKLSHTVAGATDIENTFGVAEKTTAEYGQVDWMTKLAGKVLRGNIGARAYQTSTVNTGLVSDSNGNLVPGTVSANYSGVLPAFNATLEVTPTLLVRFAAAQNINRPSLSAMALTGSVSLESGQYSVSDGNPYLKPFKTNDFDLSFEKYFGPIGMITVGLFHKDIKDLIGSETLHNVPYSVTGLSTSLAPGLTPTTIISDYSRPINFAKARINGFEAAVQSDFTFLPAPFNHLGAIANVTLIGSNTLVNGLKGPIPGLSNTNMNFTLYYDTAAWGMRASANHRSRYINSRYDGSDPTSEDGFNGTTYVDASAFWNVTKLVRLTLNAINLTNQAEVQYSSIYHRLHNETQSGRTVFAGINTRF